MIDLSTVYLGLKLRNPIIVASSGLTSSFDKVKACEDAGAGAVVLKSLFEEQLKVDTDNMIGSLESGVHADAFDFFTGYGKNYHLDQYLELVEKSIKELNIPVIPSINCVSDGSWLEFARKLEIMGAKALEVNLFLLPADVTSDAKEMEKRFFSIVKRIRNTVSIPVALKIGQHFSGLANTIREIQRHDIKGVVLFNRFYRPDIDIERMKIIPSRIFSRSEEIATSLQWIALLSGELNIDFCATTGIHDSKGLIKQLLAGAKAAQVCSTLFKNGIEYMQTMLLELQEWMKRHNYSAVTDFCGLLCQENSKHPEVYERSQYVKALTGIS